MASDKFPGLKIAAPTFPAVLTAEAQAFVADLAARFTPRVEALLAARKERQARFDAGERPDFLPETAPVRTGEWKGAPLAAGLIDRRVEITGPVDRKTIINALNSGANVFMADFEDANSPTWENLLQGQANLMDAVRGAIRFVDPSSHKTYELKPQHATLMVRPRGWHLWEEHVTLDGKPVPGALFDFGLYFFHNARELVRQGKTPAFYLPKMESRLEARLWNEVIVRAQEAVGLPRGTVRATVLIETLPAAFEMDEILYELREHSAGLNCGRWDYIFSFLKKLGNDAHFLLPDRGQVTMEQHFLRSYTQLLIRTCHRRGVHAMGGMAAQIPIKSDPEANRLAFDKVRADKLREVRDGHDGTWVAHPGLVPVAKEIFDAQMKGPHQIERLREDVQVTAADLLRPPTGTRSESGLRHNISVGMQYLEAWLRGVGCVPIYHLMEDAATAEISRMQVWQWLRHGAALEGLGPLTEEAFRRIVNEEMDRIRSSVGEERFTKGRFREAQELFLRLSTAQTPEDFLTLPAYRLLLSLS